MGQRCKGVPSYVNEVTGHVELFLCKLLSYWSSSLVFVFWGSFEKLMSDHNQTWVKDTIGVPSYVNGVIGHVELFLC